MDHGADELKVSGCMFHSKNDCSLATSTVGSHRSLGTSNAFIIYLHRFPGDYCMIQWWVCAKDDKFFFCAKNSPFWIESPGFLGELFIIDMLVKLRLMLCKVRQNISTLCLKHSPWKCILSQWEYLSHLLASAYLLHLNKYLIFCLKNR